MSEKPQRYIIQKRVIAVSVQEAIKKEPKTPIFSVFPDEKQPEEDKPVTDAIGFKTVGDNQLSYELRHYGVRNPFKKGSK